VVPGESQEAANPSFELTEVVVTAERRESTVQKTPMSITAIGAADIAAQGARSIDDVLEQIPGISGRSNGPGQVQYEMRGMSPGATGGTGGTSGTVGFYVDDIPISPPASGDNGRVSIDPNTYDVARVEVLRGPQGTLYGSGSMGGTVKLITNLPSLTGFSSSAQLLGGQTDGGGPTYGANAMLNLPLISDRLAGRIVVGDETIGGWIDRKVIAPPYPMPAPGEARGDVANAPVQRLYRNDNYTRLTTARASLLYKATDDLTITPRFTYQRIGKNTPDAYDNIPSGPQTVYQPFDVRPTFTDTIKLGSLTADYRLADVDITSISGVWRRDQRKYADISEGLSDLYQTPSYYDTGGQGFGSLRAVDDGRGTQYSQEIRIQSTAPGNLSWLIGGFYSRYHYTDDSGVSSPAFSAFTAYGPGYFPSDNFIDFLTTNDIKEAAAFANITYALPANFELRAGGRYYRYNTEFDLLFSGAASGSLVPIVSHSSAAASGFSPSITLSYLPTSDFTGYATVSRGFRPGGGNFPITNGGPLGAVCIASLNSLGLTSAPSTYSSDSVTNFELGEKLRLLDQRVTINGDVFLLRWSKVQQPVILSGGCGENFVDNAADARIKGAEAEIRVGLGYGFSFSESASYTDAKFTQSNFAADITEGQTLLGVPKWTANEVLEYRQPLYSGDMYARISENYIARRYNIQQPVTLPSQAMTNFRIGWSSDRYAVNLSVNNLFNRSFDDGKYGNICCAIPNGYTFVSTNAPRNFVIDVNAKW
jgi:outer membrane receptor protein involved in Fe transport